MIAMALWESRIEGRNAWEKGKLGWKIKIGKYYRLTSYHFYLFFIMWPLLLTLPLVISGWDLKLFGILISAYFSGIALEDFTWFIVNPKVKLSEFNPEFANHYPWINLIIIKIPVYYLFDLLIAFLSWYFIWK